MKRSYHEIKSPIRGRTKSCTFRSHGERIDLGRIKPGDTLKADAKTDIIAFKNHLISLEVSNSCGKSHSREEESYRCRRNLLAAAIAWQLIVSQEDGDEKVA